MNSRTRIFETMMLTCYCSLSPLTADRRSSTSLLMLRLPSVFRLTVFLLASCISTSFLTIGTRRSLEFTSRAPSRDKHLSLPHKNAMVTPSSLSTAPCRIDFMKTNSRSLALYATEQSQSFADSTPAWSLRAVSIAVCLAAFRDPKPLSKFPLWQ